MRAIGLSLLVVACGLGCSEPPPSERGIGRYVPPPAPVRRSVAASLYDEEGIPRESDVVVAGLRMPLGLEEEVGLRTERRHVFRSSVPPQKLLRYFGPRLTTMDIRHEREVVTYRAATPRELRSGHVPLDVTIRPSSAYAARVEVVERPPAIEEGVVVTEEEIRRQLDGLSARNRE